MSSQPGAGRPRVKVNRNGPYVVSGSVPLSEQVIVRDDRDEAVAWRTGMEYPQAEKFLLCRCGRSKNKPFCDASHSKPPFDGTETAGAEEYLNEPEQTRGPALDLDDVHEICASAGYCHPHGGTWRLTLRSDDPGPRNVAIQQAQDCPSGRLLARTKEGDALEPDLPPSIGVVEDPRLEERGPLWVRGGIPVESADGREYRVRNRVTLCRCGNSHNKPFCDGRHQED